MTTNILHLDCSVSGETESYSRRVSAAIVAAISGGGDAAVTYRNLAKASPPHIDGALRSGWTSSADARTAAQVEIVTRSEGPIAELKRADGRAP